MTALPASWLEQLSSIDFDALSEDDRGIVAAGLELYEVQDPVVFAQRRLGITAWSKQAEILRAVASHPRVAVRSGHKVGKSTSAAILALWWTQLHPDGRVVMTAPTGRQVRIVLWREVSRLYRAANPPIGGELHKVPDQGLQFDDGREVVGFSTDEPERIAGVSGANVLYIVDEGSGIDELIYEAIEGSRAGGAHLVVFGNPTQTSGTFFDAFTSSRDRWHCIHVSSEESPNVTGESRVPGLATAEWVEEKRAEWGEDSPLFQVRVRGNFPLHAENAVIGIGLVEAAVARYAEAPDDGELTIGVDVARFGDDETVIWPVRGRKALPPTVLHSMDIVAVSGEVARLTRAMSHSDERPTIKVDVIGVGAGVADHLRALETLNATIIDVNVGESAPPVCVDEPEYARLRDYVWFRLKEWMTTGAIPDDGKLQAELLAPRYGFTVDGKLKVEPKDETKKRLKRSPDRADALGLAVYQGRLKMWDRLDID
jgi:hypothetical protein